jgi:hypothetical protein
VRQSGPSTQKVQQITLPLVRKPQLALSKGPALVATWTNGPALSSNSPKVQSMGLELFAPQQLTAPDRRRPHVWNTEAEMSTYLP